MNWWMLLLAAMGLVVGGCLSMMSRRERSAAEPVSAPEERAQMQTHFHQAPLDSVFAATIAMLQDERWRLLKADRAAGLIVAEKGRRLDVLGPKEESTADYASRRRAFRSRTSEAEQWTRWEEATIHVEPWGSRMRQRLIVSRCGSLPAVTYVKRLNGRDVQVAAPARQESVEVLFREVYDLLFGSIEKAVDARRLQRVGSRLVPDRGAAKGHREPEATAIGADQTAARLRRVAGRPARRPVRADSVGPCHARSVQGTFSHRVMPVSRSASPCLRTGS
jgi:hypothetical protein